MRYGLFLLVAAASAQQPESKGFVNPGLFQRHIFEKAVTAKPPEPVLRYVPACAIPLLEVPVAKDVDNGMAVPPGKPVDQKMVLPAVPVCPSK